MTEPAFRLAPQEYDPAIPVDQISEHPDNPNEGALDLLAESLDEFGFVGGIIVHKGSGQIIAGNHRYREAVAKGAETLPGFWVDFDPDKARAYLATDNELTRAGRNNLSKLLGLLQPMPKLPPGFDAAKLATLARQAAALGETPTNPSDEWDGMPGFHQPDKPGAFVTRVHFPTDADADRFFALIDRPKATWLWWPEGDGHQGTVSDEHGPLEVAAE